MKFRLSSTVVFSSVIGYLLGTNYFSFIDMSSLMLGGILVTGSANAFNQILEKNYELSLAYDKVQAIPGLGAIFGKLKISSDNKKNKMLFFHRVLNV